MKLNLIIYTNLLGCGVIIFIKILDVGTVHFYHSNFKCYNSFIFENNSSFACFEFHCITKVHKNGPF